MSDAPFPSGQFGVIYAARGLWIELVCIMHDAEPYGHLVVKRDQYLGQCHAAGRRTTHASTWLNPAGRRGYRTFPYIISRYITAPGEVYGRSPGMTALAEIKMLSAMRRTERPPPTRANLEVAAPDSRESSAV